MSKRATDRTAARKSTVQRAFLPGWAALGVVGGIVCCAENALAADEHAHAEPAATSIVHGQVLDAETGDPMPFVRVVVGTVQQSTTDRYGRFRLQGEHSFPVVVRVDDPSVHPSELTAAAPSLTADPSAPGLTLVARYRDRAPQAVVVQGAVPPTPSASQAGVSARELQAVPLRSAEDAMRLVPGVTLVQHGSEGKGHQFFLRGFDAVHGTDLEVTLEGIPLNEWSNVHGQGYLDLGFIVPEAITSLQATKGPFYDEQGPFAMAGSVDYRLGIAEAERGARVSYSAGTTNRHRAVSTYSPHGGDGKDFVALEALHDESYGQNRALQRGALLSRFRLVDSSSEGTLSLLTAAYWAAFELPGAVRNEDVASGRTGFWDSYDSAGRGLSGRALVSLHYQRHIGRHTLELTAYGGLRRLELLENYTGYLLDPVHGDRRQQRQQTFDLGLAMKNTLRLGRRAALQYGASVHGDVLEQSQEQLDRQEQPIQVERSLRGLQAVSSVFSSMRLRPAPELSITVGGRLDAAQLQVRDRNDPQQSDAGTLLAASPRLALAWQATHPWQLFLSYGRGFRPPEARAFSSYTPPRTGLSEELAEPGRPSMTLSDAVELGTRIEPSRYLELMAAGFATFIAKEAIFDHVSGLNLEFSGTRRVGAELIVRSEPTGWLLLQADATWVDARFAQSGNPIPFAPWLSGGVRAVVTHHSGWRAGARLFALAPRALPHGARGAAMAVLDTTLGYHWQHFRLDLAVENLLNRRVREGEYHYASDFDSAPGASQLPVLHTVAGPPLNARLGLTVVY